MSRSIRDAISADATRRACQFQADETPTSAPEGTSMTDAEWMSLSPGYRRAIMREFGPKENDPDDYTHAPTLAEKKAAVEYAGRKRL